jgi:hypothetical protein
MLSKIKIKNIALSVSPLCLGTTMGTDEPGTKQRAARQIRCIGRQFYRLGARLKRLGAGCPQRCV